ncbi:right-handed parallel beta-helix repeat-containing protein [Halosimplex litoreum]|uniref:Probable pectate lyase C n=1 Tax=Halosimplex litoreum TaxID=1198301 RepID=A0A7T3FZL0_9EURY|nr:right-handed parallel beta-helix repeat-containing protein [Halosimplex litoreum]QPV63635.1 right-handed parallel beta-helix repeat-containing protein [Halosimplex litoreum]
MRRRVPGENRGVGALLAPVTAVSNVNGSGRVRAVALAFLMTLAAVAVGAPVAGASADAGTAAQTITVDAGGSGDYTTIQAAVDAAATGDTIEVGPGTYSEAVTGDKTVTIIAPNETTLDGSSLSNDPIAFDITGQAAPEVAGFTITGYYKGLHAAGSTGDWTLRDTTIENSSFGAVDADDSTGDWTIEDSVLRDDQNDAIDARGTEGDWTVRDTTATSRIYAVSASGQWTVEGVTVRDAYASGIAARYTDGAWTVRDTTLQGPASDGIDASQSVSGWEADNVTVSNADNGIRAFNTSGAWTVSDSTFRNSSDVGIDVSRSSATWTVSDSTVRNSSGAGIDAAFSSGTWTVRESAFVDNGVGVDAEYGTQTGEATRNWWGSCDGPSGEFGGSGDAAAGNLVVEPYYTDAAQTTLSNETASPCGGSTTFDFGVELEQVEEVNRSGDATVSAYPQNYADDPVANTTLELLVDADDDGRFAESEVVATNASLDFAAGEYRTVDLTYENVELSPGNYSYMARIGKDGQTTRSFTNGTLVVGTGSDGSGTATELASCGVIDRPGSYDLVSDLSSNGTCIEITASDVTLDGQGHTLEGLDPDVDKIGIYGNGTADGLTNVTVTDVELTGWRHDGFGTTGHALYLERVNHSAITDVSVTGGDIGVHLRTAADNRLDNVSIEGTKNVGLHLQNGADWNTVVDSAVVDAEERGVRLSSASNNTVRASEIRSSGAENVRLAWAANDNVFVDNVVSGTSWGDTSISVGQSGSGLEFRNNTVTGSSGHGFGLSQAGSDYLFANNTVSGNDGHGIRLNRAANATIRDNTVAASGGHGINLQRSSGHTVADNVVRDSERYGVNLNDVDDAVVAENTIERGTNGGVRLFAGSSSNELRDNAISNAPPTGVTAFPTGIQLRDADDNRIVGTEIDNAWRGIDVNASSDDNTIANTAVNNTASATRSVTLSGSVGTSVESLALSDPSASNVTLSFEGYNVSVAPAASPPDNPDGTGIGRTVDVASVGGANAFLDLTLRYEAGDVAGLDATTLGLWRHGASGWERTADAAHDIGARTLDGNVTDVGASADSVVVGAFLEGQKPFDVELEQAVNVSEGGDVNVTAYGSNLDSAPVTGTTVELLVDTDDDGRIEADEVIASRSADFDAGEYRAVDLTYEDVELSPGEYSYMARIDDGSRTVGSFTNGTLTVETNETSGIPSDAVYEAGSVAAEFDVDLDGRIGIGELGTAAEAYASGDLDITGLGDVAEAYAAS